MFLALFIWISPLISKRPNKCRLFLNSNLIKMNITGRAVKQKHQSFLPRVRARSRIMFGKPNLLVRSIKLTRCNVSKLLGGKRKFSSAALMHIMQKRKRKCTSTFVFNFGDAVISMQVHCRAEDSVSLQMHTSIV